MTNSINATIKDINLSKAKLDVVALKHVRNLSVEFADSPDTLRVVADVAMKIDRAADLLIDAVVSLGLEDNRITAKELNEESK